MTEREIEDYIISNIHTVSKCCGWGEIERFERQYVLPMKEGRIIADVMIWHKDGTGTCVEIKTGKNNRNDELTGIGQLLFYGMLMDKSLGALPRLVFVSPNLKPEAFEVVKKYKIPISFLQFTDDRCVYLGNL